MTLSVKSTVLVILKTIRDKTIKLGLMFYYAGREFFRDQCIIRSAAMTYFTMLALVPLILLVFAIFKASGGETLIENTVKPFLFDLLSTGTGEAISGAIDQLLEKSRAGAIGTIGFAFLILTAFGLMDQLELNINNIWSVKGKRSMIQRWLFYWAALSTLPLLVGLSVSLTAYIRSMTEMQEITEIVIPKLYVYSPILLQGLAFFFLFKFLPRVKVKFSAALSGALVSAIIWEFFKKTYLLYSSTAMNYNVVYGSLITLPLFMLWLFISWMAVLYGAEFSFAMQNFKTMAAAKKRIEVPFKTYEIVAVDLMLKITDRFLAGKKPLKLSEYIGTKSIPPYIIQTAAEQLMAGGLIGENDGRLVLKRDTESITLLDIAEAVDAGGTKDVEFDEEGYEEELKKMIGEIESSSDKIKSDRSLKSLYNDLIN